MGVVVVVQLLRKKQKKRSTPAMRFCIEQRSRPLMDKKAQAGQNQQQDFSLPVRRKQNTKEAKGTVQSSGHRCAFRYP
jgi:hypothetical protein